MLKVSSVNQNVKGAYTNSPCLQTSPVPISNYILDSTVGRALG